MSSFSAVLNPGQLIQNLFNVSTVSLTRPIAFTTVLPFYGFCDPTDKTVKLCKNVKNIYAQQ